jgi:FixJ family two-component response regulator
VTTTPRKPDDGKDREESVVLVIDDDESMREALKGLLRSVGLRVEVFASAAALMRSALPDVPSCLVLDVRLPELSGLDFQAELLAAGVHVPIIFITGHGDIPMTVQAMKAGAVDFLTKPFRPQEMIHAVTRALAIDKKRRSDAVVTNELRKRYESLTAREREIMALVSAGMRNKRIAADLGISEITVKVHRVHVMRKMHTNSLADLARMADQLGLRPKTPAPYKP